MTDEGQLKVIRGAAIDAALDGGFRAYLAGDLKRPQDLAHVPDADIEFGVSVYSTDAAEAPHLHPVVTEYQYVVSGRAQVRELDSGRVHEFGTGDFYVVPAGVAHAQRSVAETQIVFVKHPAIDDKILVSPDAETAAWLAAEWDER